MPVQNAMPLQLIATSERPRVNFSVKGRLTVTYLLGEWVAFSADGLSGCMAFSAGGLGGCMAFSAGWLAVWHFQLIGWVAAWHFQLVGWLCGIFS
jgi:hypothetical protein